MPSPIYSFENSGHWPIFGWDGTLDWSELPDLGDLIPVAVDPVTGAMHVKITGAAGAVTINVDEADLAALGAVSAAAYTDATGAANGTMVALEKGMYVALAAILASLNTLKGYEAPITTAAAITQDDATTAAAGRQVKIDCSAAGNVKLRLSGAVDVTLAVDVGTTLLPWAVVRFYTTGSTATATVTNLS